MSDDPLTVHDFSWSRPIEDRDERRIEQEYDRERARREARRRLDAETRTPPKAPDIATLRERLARPRTTPRWRIANWQPCDTRVMLAAAFKSGKTTFVGGTIRSLVDGDPHLGRDHVTPIAGAVALIDTEMSETMLDDWYRDQHIQNDDRVIVIPIRGAVNTFDVLDDATRASWARWLKDRNTRYLVVDCLRPILDALGLDEHREAGRLLVAIDALMAEAGIPEALIVQHMGHTAERARGDSRLRDWPDVEWRLVRQDEDPASPRFITAYGRDVDVAESQLTYDGSTRRLTVADGSRRDAVARAALDAVVTALDSAATPLSGRAVKTALADSEHPRTAIEAALRLGIQTGTITATSGAHRARLYQTATSVQCPVVSRQCPGTVVSSVPVPIGDGTLGHSFRDGGNGSIRLGHSTDDTDNERY